VEHSEWASLSPEAYHREELLAVEHATVFHGNWLFVGLTDDLPALHSWFTFDEVGQAFIVFREANGISAFKNVCSHRYARLANEPCGTGLLRCKYHGWTYNESGVPTGLPGNRIDFGLSDQEKNALALGRVEVECVGRFIFARQTRQGPPLAAWLGQKVDLLTRVSEGFGRPFADETLLWKTNWKFAVENSLEPYHAAIVHGDTLGSVLDLSQHKADTTSVHTTTWHPVNEKSRLWWRRIMKLAKAELVEGFADYEHHFIFPNLAVAVTAGGLLSIQSIWPTSAATCRMRYRLSLPRGLEQGKKGTAKALESELSDFNQRVLDEDRLQVESCQLGVVHAHHRAILGACESRVGAFQRQIVADMAGSSASAPK
jgi:choline monooxygenase